MLQADIERQDPLQSLGVLEEQRVDEEQEGQADFKGA